MPNPNATDQGIVTVGYTAPSEVTVSEVNIDNPYLTLKGFSSNALYFQSTSNAETNDKGKGAINVAIIFTDNEGSKQVNATATIKKTVSYTIKQAINSGLFNEAKDDMALSLSLAPNGFTSGQTANLKASYKLGWDQGALSASLNASATGSISSAISGNNPSVDLNATASTAYQLLQSQYGTLSLFGNIIHAYSPTSTDTQNVIEGGLTWEDLQISSGRVTLKFDTKAGVRSDFSEGFFERNNSKVFFQIEFSW